MKVHLDPQRTVDVKSHKKRWTVEPLLLDHGLLCVGNLSGPEFKVASMAQVVADWAAEMIRVREEIAPEDFSGDPKALKSWTGLASDGGDGWAASTEDPPPLLEDGTDTAPIV